MPAAQRIPPLAGADVEMPAASPASIDMRMFWNRSVGAVRAINGRTLLAVRQRLALDAVLGRPLVALQALGDRLWRRHRAIVNVGKARCAAFTCGAVRICFALRPLQDERGIGRVAAELYRGLRALSPAVGGAESSGSEALPRVHFFATIHACPDELPYPAVVMIHDVIPLILPDRFPGPAAEWSGRYLPIARQAERIVTISRFSADTISAHLGIPPARISVIGNGVTALPVGGLRGMLLPAAPYLVYLGSYDPHKNLDVVLRALCSDELRHVALVIVGNNRHYRRRVAELGLRRRVWFLGRLDDGQLGHVLGKSLALVMPSLCEGFGLPPLEAALLGVPSICSRRPAMTETLGEGAALFAEPDAPEAWREAILDLLRDADLRQRVARAAGRRALEYSWEKTVSELVQVCIGVAADAGDMSRLTPARPGSQGDA